MNKRIYFNAFHMNCVVHQSPGLWVRSDDRMHQYTDLRTWIEGRFEITVRRWTNAYLAFEMRRGKGRP